MLYTVSDNVLQLNESIKDEIIANQRMIPPGKSLMALNGALINIEDIDLYLYCFIPYLGWFCLYFFFCIITLDFVKFLEQFGKSEIYEQGESNGSRLHLHALELLLLFKILEIPVKLCHTAILYQKFNLGGFTLAIF